MSNISLAYGDAVGGADTALVLFDRKATRFPPGQISSLEKGKIVIILEKNESGWWLVQDEAGAEQGLAPSNYLRVGRLAGQSGVSTTEKMRMSVRKSVSRKSTAKRPEIKNDLLSVPEKSAHVAPIEKTNYDNTVSFAETTFFARVMAVLRSLRYGLWSRNVIIINCSLLLMLGFCSFVNSFTKRSDDDNPTLELLCGLSGMFFGVALYWFETRYSNGIQWYRALMQFCVGLLMCLEFDTRTVGLSSMLAAILCLLAFLNNEPPVKTKIEQWTEEAERSAARRAEDGGDSQIWDFTSFSTFQESLSRYYLRLRIQNKVGETVFLCLFFLALLIMFFEYFAGFVDYINDENEEYRAYKELCIDTNSGSALCDDEKYYISGWIPIAKGFGQVLNFVCAFILVPVLRTVQSIANYTFSNGFSLGRYLPLGKNYEFHIYIAVIIYVATAGHVFAHVINYTISYDFVTNNDYDLAIYTGVLLTITMIFMYGAAAEEVRRANFETFWVSHHMFMLFWFLCLLHGPRFWKWFLLPGLIYIFERFTRQGSVTERAMEGCGRHSTRVYVKNVEYLEPNVLKIGFDNSYTGGSTRKVLSHKEGMYLKLSCPHLSTMEYHPFTISSAPDDDVLTVHIKCGKPTSWTGKLKDYFMLFNPHQKPIIAMESRDERGNMVSGRWQSPIGGHLFRIDGPYSAPCVHITNYETVLLVGAGIGLTPFSSCLNSVMRQRWAKHQDSRPSHVHFVWSCRFDDFAAFQWFVEMLNNLKQLYLGYKGTMAHCPFTFEATVFLTGKPTAEQVAGVRELVGLSAEAGGRDDPTPYPPERCIQVRQGRPKFDDVFKDLQHRYTNKHIGVFCCGPMGKDLQRCCETYTRIRTHKLHGHEANFQKETTLFTLHAEVF
eukprot:Rmarinus@m.10599